MVSPAIDRVSGADNGSCASRWSISRHGCASDWAVCVRIDELLWKFLRAQKFKSGSLFLPHLPLSEVIKQACTICIA